MIVSVRLWDLAIDLTLEKATGHSFNRRPNKQDPSGTLCKKCGACCLDVLEQYKRKEIIRCPKEGLICVSE